MRKAAQAFEPAWLSVQFLLLLPKAGLFVQPPGFLCRQGVVVQSPTSQKKTREHKGLLAT
jgi:hypothetical protein